MSVHLEQGSQIGVLLAERLGLNLPKRERHDLAGPCIACRSSDAFRVHMLNGVAHCFSCGGKWSPFQLTEAVLKDREQAKALLVQLGVFRPATNGQTVPVHPADPIAEVARQKGVTRESLVAFGAIRSPPSNVQLPGYGPDGKPCTSFTMFPQGGKGLFAKGKPAGLFFPHVDGQVHLPQPGETWQLVEGPKDAAALHDLGLLACGLNTCRLNAKFARLFQGVEIVLVPDRDRAGEAGSEVTARVLRGVAKSVRIAVLPAEFQESQGEDVRDVLRRPGGRELVLQAIADAKPPRERELETAAATESPKTASVVITLPDGDPLKLTVFTTSGKPQRLVIATRGEIEHRDRINTDSSLARDRFIKKLAEKLGVERDVLAPRVDPQLTKLAGEIDEHGFTSRGGGEHDEPSQATIAASMAIEWDLWHTPAKDAYATVPVADHQETWPIRSQTFKRYLAKQFFDENVKAMNSDALLAAINLIEAKALFEGETHSIHIRVAEHDGNIYIDLCNETWQVVEVTPHGWQVLDESPVHFRRSRGMLPLPIPEHGGSIDQLRAFLNVNDDTWRLIVAWLVAAFRPRGPYPVLALFAEQGSGKSTVARMLRELVDPNSAPLRTEPKDPRDLMIGANNSWCLAYDNLSHVATWLSDSLCRLSTGGGFATRELYTDQDEVIFDSQRPVLLTSIEEVATRSDLLDRCLIVWLAAIHQEARRTEADLDLAYQAVRPRILGALLDAVATALCRLPTIKLPGLPRMADFALWTTAAETSFGWETGTFLAAYQGNRESANDVALEASPIARPLLEHLDEYGGWSGTASALLTTLERRIGDQAKHQNGWPKNARSMSGSLKRLAPNLRAAHWQIDFHREAKQRRWTIERSEFASSPTGSVQVPSSVDDDCLMQGAAEPCEWMWHDERDANDATAGSHDEPGSLHDTWEEGVL